MFLRTNACEQTVAEDAGARHFFRLSRCQFSDQKIELDIHDRDSEV